MPQAEWIRLDYEDSSGDDKLNLLIFWALIFFKILLVIKGDGGMTLILKRLLKNEKQQR